jgi:hypothetical protein
LSRERYWAPGVVCVRIVFLSNRYPPDKGSAETYAYELFFNLVPDCRSTLTGTMSSTGS